MQKEKTQIKTENFKKYQDKNKKEQKFSED